MFKAGQRVWHRNGQYSGSVIECDGDQVYILQDNGVEAEFQASDLTTTPAANAAAAPTARGQAPAQSARPLPNRRIVPADITPEHQRVLDMIPVRTRQAVAMLFDASAKGRKFSALDTAEKLNVITDITDVPYRVMREYLGRPGELGLLMGKGIADHRKG